METIYSSKKTKIKLTPNNTIIKIITRPLNEKEYEAHIIAHKLGIAPKLISHSFDDYEKKLTLEMEYVNGIFLDNYLKQPDADKKRIKNTLFCSLNKLYNNGIDHKDLCSENIFVIQKNGKLGIQIIDYGDAKIYPEPIPLRYRDYSVFNNRNW